MTTRTNWLACTAVAGALALGACGKKHESGQTLAKVDGKDVTIHEVNAELQGVAVPKDMSRNAVERVALDRVIDRKLVVNAAEAAGVDKDPAYLLQKRRQDETMLAQVYTRNLAAKVGPVTREDVDKFVAGNPDVFDQHKFFVLDQIQFLRPDNIAQLGLEKTNSLADIETVLNNAGVKFQRAPASLDALQAPAQAIQIAKLQATTPGQVFISVGQPQGAPGPVVVASTVKETRVIPFTGEPARAYARNVLQQQKVQKAIGEQLTKLIKDGKAKVTYSAGYGPPVPPKAPAPAAVPAQPAPAAH